MADGKGNYIAKQGIDIAVGLDGQSKEKLMTDLIGLMKDANKKTEQEFVKGLVDAMSAAFKAVGKQSPFNFSDIISVEGLGKQLAKEILKGAVIGGQDAAAVAKKIQAQIAQNTAKAKTAKNVYKQKKDLYTVYNQDVGEGIKDLSNEKKYQFKSKDPRKWQGEVDTALAEFNDAKVAAYKAESILKKAQKALTAGKAQQLDAAELNKLTVAVENAQSNVFSAVESMLKKANTIYQMSNTVFGKNQKGIDYTKYFDEDFFEEFDEGAIEELLSDHSEFIETWFEHETKHFEHVIGIYKKRNKKMKAELALIGDVDAPDASVMSDEQVAQSISSHKTSKGKLSAKFKKQVESALNYKFGQKGKNETLFDLQKAYETAGDSLEDQYIAALKFIQGYEQYTTEHGTDGKHLKDNNTTEVYNKALQIADVAKQSVEKLLAAIEQEEAGKSINKGVGRPKVTPASGDGDSSPRVVISDDNVDEHTQNANAVKKTWGDLIDYISKTGKIPGEFFSSLTHAVVEADAELKTILQDTGLFDSSIFKSISNGYSNLGGVVSDVHTLIARTGDYLPKAESLMPALQAAKQLGANVGVILDVYRDEANGIIYELQSTVKGEAIGKSGDGSFLGATDEQIQKLIADIKILKESGLYIDFGGDNIFYDKDNGFSFIDLGTRPIEGQEEQETVEQTLSLLMKHLGEMGVQGSQLQQFDKFTQKAYVAYTALNNGSQEHVGDIQTETAAYEAQNKVLQENISLKKKAQTTQWADFKNDAEALRQFSENGVVDEGKMKDFWRQANYDKQVDFKMLPDGEAESIIGRYIPEELQRDWYVEGKSEAKAKIEELILGNDELRNAGMNYFWKIYNKYAKGNGLMPIDSFEDFINADLKMFRGKQSENFVDGDQIIAMTPSEVTAGSFSEKEGERGLLIQHAIKPRQILGNYDITDFYNNEVEAFVPKHLIPGIADVPFNTWVNYMDPTQNEYEGTEDILGMYDPRMLAKYQSKPGYQAKSLVEGAKPIIKNVHKTLEDWENFQKMANQMYSNIDWDDFEYLKNGFLSGSISQEQALNDLKFEYGDDSYDPFDFDDFEDDENDISGMPSFQEVYNKASEAAKKLVNQLAFADPADKLNIMDKLYNEYPEMITAINNDYDGYDALVEELKKSTLTSNAKDLPVRPDGQEGVVEDGVKVTPVVDDGAVAKAIQENEVKTPAVVPVTPTVDDGVVAEAVADSTIKTPVAPVVDDKSKQLTGQTGVSISEERLRGILSEITYNVKIVGDEADSNKVAIDPESLQAAIQTIVDSIKSGEQTDNTPVDVTNAPWALEATLKGETNKRLDDIINSIKNIKVIAPKGSGNVSEEPAKAAKKPPVPAPKTPSEDEKFLADVQRYYDLQLKLAKHKDNKSYVAEIEKELEKLQEVKTILDKIKDTEQETKGIKKARVQYENELEKILDQQAKAAKKDNDALVKASRSKAKFGTVETIISKSDNTLKGVEEVGGKDNAHVQRLISSLEELTQIYDRLYKKDGVITDEEIAKLADAKNQTEDYRKTVEKLLKQMELGNGEEDIGRTVSGDSTTYYDQLKKIAAELTNGQANIVGFKNETNTLTYSIKTGAKEVSTFTLRVRDLDKGVTKAGTGVKTFTTFFDGIKRKLKEVSQYVMGSSPVYQLIAELRKGIQYVKEIDLALTELKKVTDETDETYDEFLKTAAKTGEKLGSTISAVTEATATFAKLGYNIEQASEMAEAALVYKNVGDGIASAEDAADSIISTLKGFGMEASEAMEIVDRFNEVGNRFAITSKGIGEALRLSASALNEGGNSLDESIALITAANEVVNDPSSVGTALKTLTLRLRGSKTELEEMGEDVSDMATTTSQLQAKLLALTGGKVDIMLDANTFKNSTQILREMAEAWEDMNDIQRASALELMGGKRQANVLSALIQNFDTAEKVIKTSANSAGSALKENEKYLDSIQGKIDQFTNAMQTMWTNALNSDMVKWFVDIGTEIIRIVDKVGLLNSVLLAFGAYKGFGALFKVLKDSGLTLKTLGKAFWSYATGINTVNIANAKQIFQEKILRADWIKSLATQKLKEIQTKKIADAEAHLEFVRMRHAIGVGTLEQVEKAEMLVKQASIPVDITKISTTELLSLAFSKLKANILATLKALAPFAVAVVAIVGVTHVVDALTNTTEELKEKYDELNNTLSDTESKLNDLESQLSDIDAKITEINSQDSLSFTDKEELSRLKAQSAELERQVELNEMLRKQQQTQMNESALTMANNYADVGIKTGKTTEELAESGGKAGAIVGGVGTAIGMMATGAKIGAIGGPWGIAIGAVIGAIAGGVIGALGGAAVGAIEEDVGDSLENMKEQHEKLLTDFNKARDKYQKDPSKNNKKKFEEAQKALQDYEAATANHLSQMDAYYSQIDWETATEEQRKAMQEFYDTQDKWAIQSNGANAKSNAIARIFGENASDDIKGLKDDIEEAMNAAKVDGTDPNFDFHAVFSSEKFSELRQRLYDMGLTVTDVKYYFLDLAKAEKEAADAYTTYDTVKQINSLAGGVKSLKDAFGEISEEGYVSTETLVELEETFGGLGDSWENFVDTVATGTGSIKEATEAINELLEAYLMEKLASGPMTAEEQLKTIMLLQQLGVKNAKEYIDAMQKVSMVQTIATNIANNDKKESELKAKVETGTATDEDTARYNELVSKSREDYIEEIEELYGIDLTDEEERLLIEKAVTAEKKEQAAIEASKKQSEYDQAVYDKKVADEKLKAAKQAYADFNSEGMWKYGGTRSNPGYINQETGEFLTIAEWGKKKTQLEQDIVEAQKNTDAIEIPLEPSIDSETLKQEAETAKNELQDVYDDLGLTIDVTLKDPHELVDDIQSVFDTLVDAQKEYEENGYLSVDTLQTLLKLEPKYLDLLVDEEGNLNLTKDALYNVARARITDMGIQSQKNILESATKLAMEGSSEALREEISVMESANEVGADFVSVQMAKVKAILAERVAAGELSQTETDAFIEGTMNQIKAVQVATQSALDNLNNSFSSSGNTATQEANDVFQDAMDYWTNRIGAAESRFEQVQNEIDLLESQGKRAGAGYYQEQMDLITGEGGKLDLLNQQLAEAESALEKVPEGSDEWWKIANTINDIHNEIDQTTMSIQDLKDAMADTHWYVFDEAHDRVSTLASDLENIRDILSNEKLFDEEGNFTKEGLGTLASYVQELGVFEGALAHAKDEMELFGDTYDPNKKYVDAQGNDLSIDSEQDWYDAVKKAEEKYDDLNNKVIETKYNIKDLYEQQIDAAEEYTHTLIENYNEYIDAVKEALDSERDLYEFKKSTEKKSKNMAAIERRIASLSGSTNAADIAERRKLQAELMDAKSDMDDHYYSHSKEQQSQALDNEMTAYETAMNAYIEGLRTKLEESTAELYKSYEEMGTETKNFVDGVTQSVILNAGNVESVYKSTGEAIDQALVTPWTNAAAKIGWFASSDEALGMMNSWTEATSGALFYDFQTKVSQYLQAPWTSADLASAVSGFKSSLETTMSDIVSDVNTNVSNIISHLQTEIDKIKDTEIRIKVKEEKEETGGGGGGGASKIVTSGTGSSRAIATISMYAKGTTGTTRDQWALTDESWLGDELVLVPGKDGNLSFMRKGTGVVPADMTQKLFELAQIPTSDLMNKSLTAIVPNITKNDFKNEFKFESLVHVDTVDSDTLPKLEKMVDKKIDDFSKALNYSLKRFAR